MKAKDLQTVHAKREFHGLSFSFHYAAGTCVARWKIQATKKMDFESSDN